MCLYLQCTCCMGSRRLAIASYKKSSEYFIIYNSSKKQRLATLAMHLRSRCLGNITAQKMSDTLNSYIGKKHSSSCAFNVNEHWPWGQWSSAPIPSPDCGRATYTWCPKNKQLTEFLRNGFNLLWVSPADMNESILALVDLLTWLTGPKSHNKFTLSPDTKLNESKYFY